MAAKRIGKSAVDWAKFAKLVPESDRGNYNVFKARSDAYLMSVLANPEKPNEPDWATYRNQINNKAVVDQLQAAYKALQVPYPKDTSSNLVDDEEKRTAVANEQFVKLSNDNIKDAEALQHKFKIMIPYGKMMKEDYEMTFPDWCVSREVPSIWPHEEKSPGLTKEERAEYAKPDGPPYSIP